MYDVVIIGQGLSGMLSAIWSKEQGYHTAVVASGTGKIIQSTGVFDFIPGSNGDWKAWKDQYQLNSLKKSQLSNALEQFKALTLKLGYPYRGEVDHPISIVTGSGRLKSTTIYPETIHPIPDHGQVVVVGFQEVVDFQPEYIKANLQKERPSLTIDTFTLHLGPHSQRTLTQLDAAHLLDQPELRRYCIKQIKSYLEEKNINQPDLVIFPASLGVDNWKETIKEFSSHLGVAVTEAPGLPPNATAIRLQNLLKKEAVKMGVRFYADTTVMGCELEGKAIKSLRIKTSSRVSTLEGEQFILATGGILGGGLEVTEAGVKEMALKFAVNEFGEILNSPENLYSIGASRGTNVTRYGITGGIYSIYSSSETVQKLQQSSIGGSRNVRIKLA
jgi:glycerol-3-phosphate dehydrogenase subunit B